jgi:hypothetical protein
MEGERRVDGGFLVEIEERFIDVTCCQMDINIEDSINGKY